MYVSRLLFSYLLVDEEVIFVIDLDMLLRYDTLLSDDVTDLLFVSCKDVLENDGTECGFRLRSTLQRANSLLYIICRSLNT